jgi:hypothetical protein
MELNAKFSGLCRKCGGRINAGDRINWVNSTGGASHVTCPAAIASAVVSTATVKPVVRQVVRALVVPVLADETAFEADFREGEYCSGTSVCTKDSYNAAAVNALCSLEVICHELSGWGTIMNDAAHKVLGDAFTWAQAKAYALPILEAARAKKQAALDAKLDKRQVAFDEAARTGMQVVLRKWSEECDGSEEECDIDNITEYAHADGTTHVSRSHSY